MRKSFWVLRRGGVCVWLRAPSYRQATELRMRTEKEIEADILIAIRETQAKKGKALMIVLAVAAMGWLLDRVIFH